jgi:hypothetical protein
MSPVELLVSDSWGVYIPKEFANRFDTSLWNNIDEEDLKTITQGPEAEWYWESWDNIVSSAQFKHEGHTWHLWQDGNLWAYCPDLMTDEEYEEFFGEPRDQ